jgi:hypothetical protein
LQTQKIFFMIGISLTARMEKDPLVVLELPTIFVILGLTVFICVC